MLNAPYFFLAIAKTTYKIIDKQIENKQFENCDITFKDIKTIKSVIKKKLSNIYHIRVEYPEI